MSPVFGVGSSFKELPGFRPIRENEDALSSMCRSDVGSTQARPACVIPERGQVAEYTVKSAAADGSDVLHDDKLRS
jgi:hypothetical protein